MSVVRGDVAADLRTVAGEGAPIGEPRRADDQGRFDDRMADVSRVWC